MRYMVYGMAFASVRGYSQRQMQHPCDGSRKPKRLRVGALFRWRLPGIHSWTDRGSPAMRGSESTGADITHAASQTAIPVNPLMLLLCFFWIDPPQSPGSRMSFRIGWRRRGRPGKQIGARYEKHSFRDYHECQTINAYKEHRS